MFSEVYWHHGVRAATAMFQRAFYLLHGALDLDALFRLSEHEFVAELQRVAGTGPAGELLRGLFGPTRQLYKRLAQFGFSEGKELYQRLARRPYPWLAACCEHFAALASSALGRVVAPHEILFDAPPVSREVQISIEIQLPKKARGEVWPRFRRWFAFGHGAVRRLRQAGPHLRPSPPGHRDPPLAEFSQLLDQAIERTG